MGCSVRPVYLAILLTAACALGPVAAGAEDFDWADLAGQSFVTGVRNQGSAGTCWAFAAVAALEAKYKLTRNDPTFSVDLSEQQLVCDGSAGTVTGGWPNRALVFFVSSGVVAESELSYTGLATSPNWPLHVGWQDRAWKADRVVTVAMGTDIATIKANLKRYGPLTASISIDNDWYNPAPGPFRTTHAVLITGFHDDSLVPGGGYWIVKNSWGTSWGLGGYAQITYEALQNEARLPGLIYGIDGAAYCTGAMATANWQGGSGTWAAGRSTQWNNGVAYLWENQETAAVFGVAGPAMLTVSGTVIAHGLTFNSGASGYTIAGGPLTITSGGIVANESLAISSPVTIGAPQTWTVAAGKVLTVTGTIHTVISDLTVDGGGNTVLSGGVDGGGVINDYGAKTGKLIKRGTGLLTITGSNSFNGGTTILAGTLQLGDGVSSDGSVPGSVTNNSSLAFANVNSQGFGGVIRGTGNVVKKGPGTLTLSGSSPYSGGTIVLAGTLNVTGMLAGGSSVEVSVAVGDSGAFGGTIRRNVLPGGTYAHLGSSVFGDPLGLGADLRQGANGDAGTKSVAMQWRDSAGSGGEISGVLRLSGMDQAAGQPGETDAFVLSMAYDPERIVGMNEGACRTGEWLTVGHFDGRDWGKAAMDNLLTGSLVNSSDLNYDGSWDAFRAAHGITDTNLANYLGSWGVDTASNQVWAVLDYNGDFAALPEPCTLAFLAVGGLLVIRRRRL